MLVVKQSVGGTIVTTETSSDVSTRRGDIFIIWPIWSKSFHKVERERKRERYYRIRDDPLQHIKGFLSAWPEVLNYFS